MLESLLAELKKHIEPEIIDGSDVEKTAELVELDVAYTPVVRDRVSRWTLDRVLDWPDEIPKPIDIQKDGGRYAIPLDRYVPEDQLKVMRARYLLLRGFFYQNLRRMAPRARDRAVAWYFPGGVWQPAEGSEL